MISLLLRSGQLPQPLASCSAVAPQREAAHDDTRVRPAA